MWRAPSRPTSWSASSRDCDQWLSRRPESRRCTTLSERSLTISIRVSDDFLRRSHERRRKGDAEGARGVEIDDQVGLAEILERNLLRALAAHDACGEVRGVTAAVLVVARHDHHRTADGLRFLEREDRQAPA